MQVFINGKPISLEKSGTLEQVLKDLNINQDHSFAVALNAEAMLWSSPKHNWLKLM